VYFRTGGLHLPFFVLSASIIAGAFAVAAWLAASLAEISWRTHRRHSGQGRN
jgi:hypothetical protein